jgi:hypothetical protein
VRIEVEIAPDPRGLTAEVYLEGEVAVTKAISAAGIALKAGWRAQIRTAGLGARLANTIRERVYPQGEPSMNAASLVWTRAPKIVDAFERGALIRSKDGFWLAIPTAAAGTGPGRKRITPGGWELRTGRRLRFVYRPRGPSLLVADDARIDTRGIAQAKGGRRRKDGILSGAATVPIFLLVPQVKLRKRLDIERLARATGARIPALILANWKDRR